MVAMDKYLYLFINIGSIIVPFIYSFHKKMPFVKLWKSFFVANILVGIVFIIWDMFFTHMGVWGFNTRYLLGIHLYNLPLEEMLFFLCIPYACVFTYEALNFLIKKDYFSSIASYISLGVIVVCLVLGIIYRNNWYTAVTMFSLSILIAWISFIMKASFLSRFYLAFIIVLIPFFIVNGLLTGSYIPQEVVWYNEQEIIGLRLGTIPLEDTFYAMFLLLSIVTIHEQLKKKFGIL